VLRNDPSMDVRERGGCSLAKSGMLTREQRMKAVPGLIELAADTSVNDVTRSWAFQALREIANEPLGNDAPAWRNWFSAHGTERANQFRQEDVASYTNDAEDAIGTARLFEAGYAVFLQNERFLGHLS